MAYFLTCGALNINNRLSNPMSFHFQWYHLYEVEFSVSVIPALGLNTVAFLLYDGSERN
jgi:hypothetical protein